MGHTECTEPHCLYITTKYLLFYGPYRLYRASDPVQYNYTSSPNMDRTDYTEPQCLYNTFLPLRSLRSVKTLESLSTSKAKLLKPYCPYGFYRNLVPVRYKYTAILSMGLTAFTEPPCLYSTAKPLLLLWTA